MNGSMETATREHRMVPDARRLLAAALEVRAQTVRLTEPLTPEDCAVQSMPDASPTKWHLAHTTWFFERFVLRPLGVSPIDERYEYLFNSYYDGVGPRHPRAARGLLTRPSLGEILHYRKLVDERLAQLRGRDLLHSASLLELGMNHEEQHQELILTDIKHLFGASPLRPRYAPRPRARVEQGIARPQWIDCKEGLADIGHPERGARFAFDHERPRHRVYIAPFSIRSKLVTVGEYEAFVQDGGYLRPELWLSDGFAWVRAEGRRAPLYWEEGDSPGFGPSRDRAIFTLHGVREADPEEPVCHVSYYEADAFARWSSARLPTESEWETFVVQQLARGEIAPFSGHFLDDHDLHPRRASAAIHPDRRGTPRTCSMQLFGDTWEWTSSAYAPYPGYRPTPGVLGEYNAKFMANQFVLRGGSCVTPRRHVRATYRNFFPPGASWQFTGIRLARSL